MNDNDYEEEREEEDIVDSDFDDPVGLWVRSLVALMLAMAM
jgi:hypothetical protein